MSHHSSQSWGRASVLLLALLLLAGSGCNDSDPLIPPQEEEFELNYDGANLSSPVLAAGTYEAAARFTSTKTADLAGGELTEVRFHITSIPTSCKVKIYGANTAGAPGALLYTANVTTLVAASWNTHVLQNPVLVPNGDLWISIEFVNSVSQPTIGCDAGPAVPDGDWLFSSADTNWIPFSQRTAVSINWNIRGIVKVTT